MHCLEESRDTETMGSFNKSKCTFIAVAGSRLHYKFYNHTGTYLLSRNMMLPHFKGAAYVHGIKCKPILVLQDNYILII